ncbi:hypothetical protein EXIGLDRAFT_474967 [Exidia glandulosa HHB12029]|uniref:Uncharacterized protein n=1 Tax=Exidia glandulosa HHB12029 TaxID=1314781 RepID=A0A165JWI4_EXIGL|nr:hypothetical protein EXIGLDRAFT_474967 [Exidia glandulosa HHB12029]
MQRRFPRMYERMQACVDWHQKDAEQRGAPFKPLFAPFLNCCVNAPSPEVGVERVTTRPHTDARNAGTFYCAFLTYWDKEWLSEHEWSFLAIWELGIIIACPRGAWVIYPSALLLHFNVRIVKCKKGEMPTPLNTEELHTQGKSRRGSIVFFTQATMISVTDERERIPALASYESAVAHCFPSMLSVDSLMDGLS